MGARLRNESCGKRVWQRAELTDSSTVRVLVADNAHNRVPGAVYNGKLVPVDLPAIPKEYHCSSGPITHVHPQKHYVMEEQTDAGWIRQACGLELTDHTRLPEPLQSYVQASARACYRMLPEQVVDPLNPAAAPVHRVPWLMRSIAVTRPAALSAAQRAQALAAAFWSTYPDASATTAAHARDVLCYYRAAGYVVGERRRR
jgi:hypothetical protein